MPPQPWVLGIPERLGAALQALATRGWVGSILLEGPRLWVVVTSLPLPLPTGLSEPGFPAILEVKPTGRRGQDLVQGHQRCQASLAEAGMGPGLYLCGILLAVSPPSQLVMARIMGCRVQRTKARS